MKELFDYTSNLVEAGGVWGWAIAFGVALGLAAIVKTILHLINLRLKKAADRTSYTWDDIVIDLLGGTKAWVLFIWFFTPFVPLLQTTERAEFIAKVLAVIAGSFQIAFWGLRLISSWRRTHILKATATDASSAAAIGLLATSLQGIFLVIVLLIALSNLGINVGAMIAGLGVGGIAVALAAQNILGDLLASLSIVMDKPFVIGDFIAVGDMMGTVEEIGLKTTRLRSLSGEELIFSNKDLLESRLKNYKRMWQRRVVLKFGVTYSTPAEKLEQIPVWVKDFVEAEPDLKFDRSHLSGYGDSSLNFETVFMVLSSEYNIYMDIQQRVMLKIIRRLKDKEIEFAFPSQSIYVESLPKDFSRKNENDRVPLNHQSVT